MKDIALDEDGDPVWNVAAGDQLVDGVVAWQRLGVGLRCETWLGWSRPLWCAVAVKLPRPHQRTNVRARRSLGREVAALQDNPHPALPRLISAALDEPLPYVGLEYIDGEPLDELAETQPLNATSTALLATHLLAAVTPVHARGIAHLDIKPENVVIRDARPVLLDFGSARPLDSWQPAGHPVGTVGYSAPEMEACEPISAAMDVYGIGATLREAFTGFSPYDLDPRRRVLAARPPYPPGHPELVNLIRSMLAPLPVDRPTVPEALDSFADLCEPADRPWPSWLSAAGPRERRGKMEVMSKSRHDSGVPTFDDVRAKIEGRFAQADGQAELDAVSTEGKQQAQTTADRAAAAQAALDKIRASLRE